jgi:hypothetical protein
MAPQVSQDSFIDEEDDTWYVFLFDTRSGPSQPVNLPFTNLLHLSPLCVEEFDLSDKNFRPCPCGYQVRISLDIHLLTRANHLLSP